MANFSLAAGVFSIFLGIYFWVKLTKGTARAFFQPGLANESKSTGSARVRPWLLGIAALSFNLSLATFASRLFPSSDSTQSADLLKLMRDPLGLGVVLFLTLLLAPITEEFLFRGLITTGYQRIYSVKPRAAILLSAVLFACSHGLNHFLGGFVFAYLLGVIATETRSLRSNMVIHAVNNAFGIGMIYFHESSLSLTLSAILFCVGGFCASKK